MIALLDNFHLVFPEVIIFSTVCLALLMDLFFHHRAKSIAYYIACVGLILAIGVSFLYLGTFKHILFNGLFISDDMGHLMKITMLRFRWHYVKS